MDTAPSAATPSLAGQEAGRTRSRALPVVTPGSQPSRVPIAHRTWPQPLRACRATLTARLSVLPAPGPLFFPCHGVGEPGGAGQWDSVSPRPPSPCPGSPRMGTSADSTQEAVSVSPGHGDQSTRHLAVSPHGGQGGHRNWARRLSVQVSQVMWVSPGWLP